MLSQKYLLNYYISHSNWGYVDKLNEQFRQQFEGITHFTYRQGFEQALEARKGKILHSDAGWGCVIRTGQMMFCQALKRHFIQTLEGNGKSFSLQELTSKPQEYQMYLDIISMFQDNQHAQFGLQNICRVA
jgi:hypothetical protein